MFSIRLKMRVTIDVLKAPRAKIYGSTHTWLVVCGFWVRKAHRQTQLLRRALEEVDCKWGLSIWRGRKGKRLEDWPGSKEGRSERITKENMMLESEVRVDEWRVPGLQGHSAQTLKVPHRAWAPKGIPEVGGREVVESFRKLTLTRGSAHRRPLLMHMVWWKDKLALDGNVSVQEQFFFFFLE